MNKFISAALLALWPSLAGAADFPLMGSWKLESYYLESGGKRTDPYGAHPDGIITYEPNGRMHAILMPHARPKSSGSEKDDAALLRNLVAYTGRYTLEGPDKVVHHVDLSWNETLTGTDQIRFFKLVGDKLTLSGPPIKNATGQETRFVLEWSRSK